jgi:hypothetical protein
MPRSKIYSRRYKSSAWKPLASTDHEVENTSLMPGQGAAVDAPPGTPLVQLNIALGTGSRKPTKSQLSRSPVPVFLPSVSVPATGSALKLALSTPPSPAPAQRPPDGDAALLETTRGDECNERSSCRISRASPAKRLYFLTKDQLRSRTCIGRIPSSSFRYPLRPVQNTESWGEALPPHVIEFWSSKKVSTAPVEIEPTRRASFAAESTNSQLDAVVSVPQCESACASVAQELSSEKASSDNCAQSENRAWDPIEVYAAASETGESALEMHEKRQQRLRWKLSSHQRKSSISYFSPNDMIGTPPRPTCRASAPSRIEAGNRNEQAGESESMAYRGLVRASPRRLHHHAEELLLANVRFLGERVRELEEHVRFLQRENEVLRAANSRVQAPEPNAATPEKTTAIEANQVTEETPLRPDILCVRSPRPEITLSSLTP